MRRKIRLVESTAVYTYGALASLLCLCVRGYNPQTDQPYDYFADQLKDFHAGSSGELQQAIESFINLSSDKKVGPLLVEAQKALGVLLTAMEDSDEWGVCGTVKIEKLVKIAAL